MSIMRCKYCETERDTDFKTDCECEKSILIDEIIDIIGFGRKEELECKAEKIIKLFNYSDSGISNLISSYKEEYNLCDYRMIENAKLKEYVVAENWRRKQKEIKLFLTDLERLKIN